MLVYSQILLGATMRHTGAGMAIPTFPLAFGHVLPPVWSAAIAIHFAHRAGALVVLSAIAHDRRPRVSDTNASGEIWPARRRSSCCSL